MKKLICAALSAVTCIFTSCGLNSTESNKSSEAYKNMEVEVGSTVIDALQNNDAETIKNLFSNRAKELCGDELDEGIQFMLDLYEGDFIKVTNSNQGGSTADGGRESYVKPVRIIQTTTGYYKLCWNACGKNMNDEDQIGVYSMMFEEWEDEGLGTGGRDLPVAGIVTYENRDMCENTFDIIRIIYQQEYLENYRDDFRKLFTDELADDMTDEIIDDFIEQSHFFGRISFDNCWIEHDSNNKAYACMITTRDPQRYMCLAMDDNQPEKISYLKTGTWDGDHSKFYSDGAENAGFYLEE